MSGNPMNGSTLNRLARCRPLLGTYVEITLEGDLNDAQLIEISQLGFAAIEHIQELMSFHSNTSELTRINRHAHLEPQAISVLTFELLQHALQLSELSQGVFDVTIGSTMVKLRALPDHGFCFHPSATWQAVQLQPGCVFFSQPLQMDLGGIAKGFAVDKAVAAMAQAGGPSLNIVVNAGGDMRMTHWQGQTVGIRHPQYPQQIVPVALKNTALATSASYFLTAPSPTDSLSAHRGIYSPKTQTPIHTKHSYSVFANSGLLADALTKVVALMENPAPLLKALQAEALIL
jgi:FAD:protein FMN transferase